jgi:hypothetical protein
MQIERRKKILNWLVKNLVASGEGDPDLSFYKAPASYNTNHSREAN